MDSTKNHKKISENEGRKMPPAQAIVSSIYGAKDSLIFLRELQSDWEDARELNIDGSLIRRHQRIVADAFTMYIRSIFDSTKGTHSLVKSYMPHQFIRDFHEKDIVKKCILHANNRFGHQHKNYGFVVSLDLILSSEIEAWLNDAHYAVATGKLSENGKNVSINKKK